MRRLNMKSKIVLVTLCALLLGTAISCKKPSPTLVYFPQSGQSTNGQSPTVGAYAKGGTTIKWYVSDRPFNIQFKGGAAPCKDPTQIISATKDKPATCEVVVPKGADPNTVFSYQYMVIFDPQTKTIETDGPFPDHVGNCDGCTPGTGIILGPGAKPVIQTPGTTGAGVAGATYNEVISCSGTTANVNLPSQDVYPQDNVFWQADDSYTWAISFTDASVCPGTIDQDHSSCHVAKVPSTMYPYTVIVSKNGSEVCRSNPDGKTNLNVLNP
jgi:hypothetical protein